MTSPAEERRVPQLMHLCKTVSLTCFCQVSSSSSNDAEPIGKHSKIKIGENQKKGKPKIGENQNRGKPK